MALVLAGDGTSLGVGVETTYGTAVAATAWVPFNTHDFDVKNNPSKNMSVKKARGASPVGAGQIKVSGSIDTDLDNSAFAGILIGSTLGAETYTASGSAYIHTFKFAPVGTALPSLTFIADDGDGSKQTFTGCKVDTLSLSIKPGDMLSAKFSLIGQNLAVSSGSNSPTIVNDAFFEYSHWAAGTSTVNGSSYQIQDFTISIKNNLKDVYGSNSGRQIYALAEQQVDVSGSFTVILDNANLPAFRAMLLGSISGPVSTTPSPVPIVFGFAQPAVGGVAPAISFSMANCTLTEGPITRQKNNLLSMNVKFVTQESTPGAADDIVITMTNSTSTLYI